MKRMLSIFAACLCLSAFADAEVVSDGDVDPSEWSAEGQQRVVLWADANGNYSMPENAPIVMRDEVAGLVESNDLVVARNAILAAAAEDALDLVRVATYNVSSVPTLFSTPRITSFKLAVVIDQETFRVYLTGFGSSQTVEDRQVTVDGVQTNINARLWTLDFATTDSLQTVTPDVACVQVLDGFAAEGGPTYLLSELYTMQVIQGTPFTRGTDLYENFYRLSMWLPTYYDDCFIRLDFDPEAGAAATDGSVTEIGGIAGGLTYDETLSDGSVIHYEKGVATVEGSSFVHVGE